MKRWSVRTNTVADSLEELKAIVRSWVKLVDASLDASLIQQICLFLLSMYAEAVVCTCDVRHVVDCCPLNVTKKAKEIWVSKFDAPPECGMITL